MTFVQLLGKMFIFHLRTRRLLAKLVGGSFHVQEDTSAIEQNVGIIGRVPLLEKIVTLIAKEDFKFTEHLLLLVLIQLIKLAFEARKGLKVAYHLINI